MSAGERAVAAIRAVDDEIKTAEHKGKRQYRSVKRKRAVPREPTSKEKRMLDMERIWKELKGVNTQDADCCHGGTESRPCALASKLPIDDIVLPIRTKYVALAHEAQRMTFLVDLICALNPLAPTSSRRKLRFGLGGRSLCEEGFRRGLGIGRKKLRKAINMFRGASLLPPAHTHTLTDHASLQSDAVFGWLTQYFKTVCDDVPTAAGVRRVMTFWRSWPDVHALFASQFRAEHGAQFKPPSFTVFERVRLDHFHDVVRPAKGTQPACTVCVAITAELERGDERNRSALLRQLHEHGTTQHVQRRDTQAELDAELATGKALAARFDYMSPANVPHYRRPPKVHFCALLYSDGSFFVVQVLARKRPLDVRVAGAYVQGSDKAHNGLYIILHLTSILKDGNTVATLLHEVISHARLPHHEHLVLSFDNAVAEGKNFVILALAVLWVSLGWFTRVRILNLLPGHTHNYLDALFSHVQNAVRTQTIASLADIVDAISKSSFHDPLLQPKVYILNRSWDWRRLFGEHVLPLAGHSVPLGFSIEHVPSLPPSEPARMLVRDLSTDQWLGLERSQDPIDVLKQLPRGRLFSVPLCSVARSLDMDELHDCVRTAERHSLLHKKEAEDLRRVISDGTFGAVTTGTGADDGLPGVPGYIQRPDTNDRVAVRVITGPPTSLQPPVRPADAAAAAPAAPPPPVPIFFKPRVSVITHRKHKLKAMREAAEQQQAAAKAGGGGSSGPSSASASLSAAASSAATTTPSTRVTRSKTPSPSPSAKSPSPSLKPPMVRWEDVDDEMDESMEG